MWWRPRCFTLTHPLGHHGAAAFDEVGVLPGYRGVVVLDRWAMYWRLKAKHGVCQQMGDERPGPRP